MNWLRLNRFNVARLLNTDEVLQEHVVNFPEIFRNVVVLSCLKCALRLILAHHRNTQMIENRLFIFSFSI